MSSRSNLFKPQTLRQRIGLGMLIVGAFVVAVQILYVGKLSNSALMYMLIPFAVSFAILKILPKRDGTLGGHFVRHVMISLLILFFSSVVLREGFICVIFFIPIYLFMVMIGYALYWVLWDRRRVRESNKKYVQIVPFLILLASMEGTIEPFSFPRDHSVSVSQQLSLSLDEVKQNMLKPINLEKERDWLMSLFIMPYKVEAGTLKEGDVHTAYTRYHRWFVTNTHEGVAKLKLTHVEDNFIELTVIEDSTYFSTYLNLKKIRVYLTPIGKKQTNIEAIAEFHRNLDPAWYFVPLEKFGVAKMLQLIINEVVIRENV